MRLIGLALSDPLRRLPQRRRAIAGAGGWRAICVAHEFVARSKCAAAGKKPNSIEAESQK